VRANVRMMWGEYNIVPVVTVSMGRQVYWDGNRALL
jgi:hypothetical protein